MGWREYISITFFFRNELIGYFSFNFFLTNSPLVGWKFSNHCRVPTHQPTKMVAKLKFWVVSTR